MQVIDTLAALDQAKLDNVVVALGNFDGVHLGHRKLIGQAIEQAKKLAASTVVLTFNPHPLKLLAPEKFPKLLSTYAQRVEMFRQLGVDIVILLPFSLELANLSPRQFVTQVLLEKLHAVHVCVGFNYSFGKGGQGTAENLGEFGRELNFGVTIVEQALRHGKIISSTEIRDALEHGEIEEAHDFLGYWPTITGKVVRGDQRGRLIGFPTANLEPPDDLLIPTRGVYAAWARVGGKVWPAMVNIGLNPTFKLDNEYRIETHIFNFGRNIYGERLDLIFRKKLREERKFNGIAELRSQLTKDKLIAGNVLQANTKA